MRSKNLFISSMMLAALVFIFSPTPIEAGENEAAVKRYELTIIERKVQAEENTLRITQGDSVELVWLSDEAAELHLHGSTSASKCPLRPPLW